MGDIYDTAPPGWPGRFWNTSRTPVVNMVWETKLVLIRGDYQPDVERLNKILAEDGWEPYAVSSNGVWLRRQVERTD